MIGVVDPSGLDRMLSRLIHRGPDDEGRHLEHGFALGVRRLRVIDPAGGHQPMANETKTVWVALNGEIYNYLELRHELERKGHRFASNCDTEVLVHLYEEEGEEGVQRLRGMFAYAVWDRNRRTLWLVRDRFGIKPLYYTSVAGNVIFASELPALLAAVPPPSIRPHAIAQYLAWLYVPGPGTVFEGIHQLRPGELVRVTDGCVETRRYWAPDWITGVEAWTDPPERQERFLELLRDSVRAHLVSDVPLGLFLSGGLDSGALLAMMRAATNGRIRTFSIGYAADEDRSYDELEAARLLARCFETEHTEERLRPDVVKLLSRIVEGLGEPFADASAIPTYLVSEMARRSVTVALSGIGGDELFGGYPRYLGIRLAAAYARLPARMRAGVAACLAPMLPEGSRSRDWPGRLKRFFRDGHRPLAEQYVRWITFLPPEWGPAALTPELLDQVDPAALTQEYAERFHAWPSADPSDRAMGLDLQTYLPDDLLRMGDRLSMAHSLELRVPFCDPALHAFAMALPAPVRFTGWRLKGFMREALRRVLPRPILARAKFGFQVPLARWLREDLRELAYDLLSDEAVRRRGYVRPEYVHWLLSEHESGTRNLSDSIYALLVLELWHRAREA